MSAIPAYPKHPDAWEYVRIDVDSDVGASPVSAIFIGAPAGLTFDHIDIATDHVMVLIKGGTDGTTYKVNGEVLLDNGAKPVAEFHVRVANVP